MRKLAVVALAVVLAGCSARGIITSDKQVVVQAWTHSMAVTFAEGECARYGRNAILVGSSWETFVFDCRAPGEVPAVQVPQIPVAAAEMPLPVARAPDSPPPPVNRAPPPPPPPQSAPKPPPPPPPVAVASPPPPAATAAPPPERQAARSVAPAPPAAAAKPQPGWWVQVAADRTRKEAEATGRRVIKKFSTLLKQRKYRIVKVTVRDIGVYYRSRFGPYPSKTAALKACYAMKKRKQSCIIAR